MMRARIIPCSEVIWLVTKESDQRQIIISIIIYLKYISTQLFFDHQFFKLCLSFIFSTNPFENAPSPRPMADVAGDADAGDAGGATPGTSAPSAPAAVEDDVVEAEESPTNPQEKPTEAPWHGKSIHLCCYSYRIPVI